MHIFFENINKHHNLSFTLLNTPEDKSAVSPTLCYTYSFGNAFVFLFFTMIYLYDKQKLYPWLHSINFLQSDSLQIVFVI